MHYRRTVTVAELEGFKEGISSKEFKENFELRPFRAERNIDGFNVEINVLHDLEQACSHKIFINGVNNWDKIKIENVIKKVTGLKFNLPTKEFSNDFTKSPWMNKKQKGDYAPFDRLYYQKNRKFVALHFRLSSLCKPIPPGRL
ncbi:MAG: hypothetical protein VXV96_06490 [Bdellovibrionota bacterium]|nr:hypothetical protein [Bdellovibrionota bacterium]